MSVGGKQINFVGYIYASAMRKVLSFLYLEKLIRLSINSNTENNSFVLILCALVMRIPFCGINTQSNKELQIRTTYYILSYVQWNKVYIYFADKRTGKKGDAKNTGWFTRGGRTSSQS